MTLHRTTARRLLAAFDRAKMTKRQLAIFGAIAGGRGRLVSREAIYEAVWGHRADGGPLCPEWAIRVHVSKLRKLGYNIRTDYNWGYALVPSPAPVSLRAAA